MAGEAGSSTPPSKALEQTHGLRDYYRVLAANRQFRFLWCAEMIDNIGSWLVRGLGLDERPDRGLATDGLMLCMTAPFGCRLAALVLRLLNLLHAPPRKPLPHSRTWPPWSWWSSLAAAVGWPSRVWSSSASCPPSSSHPSAAWWPTGARACPHRLLCGSVTGLGTRIPEAAKQILPACCPQATHACQPALCLPLNRFPLTPGIAGSTVWVCWWWRPSWMPLWCAAWRRCPRCRQARWRCCTCCWPCSSQQPPFTSQVRRDGCWPAVCSTLAASACALCQVGPCQCSASQPAQCPLLPVLPPALLRRKLSRSSPRPTPPAARKALVPVLVPADQLHLATTIDRCDGQSVTPAGSAGDAACCLEPHPSHARAAVCTAAGCTAHDPPHLPPHPCTALPGASPAQSAHLWVVWWPPAWASQPASWW